MARAPKPPTLQVLFEPFPNFEDFQAPSGAGAFAGMYWLDALNPDGTFRTRGYRATFEGCPYCRRHDDNLRAHWNIANDLPAQGSKPKIRHCGRWKLIEKIVREFGGWKRVHYVELAANEGLHYQPVPQRRRVIEPCPVCKGKGFTDWDVTAKDFTKCDAGCGSYGFGTKGEVQITYEGPVRPDRHAMSAEQRRMRV